MLMRPSILPADFPLPLWQSPEFVTALRRLGVDAEIQALDDVGQAMIVRRSFGPFGSVGFTSRGPIWASGAAPSAQVDALRSSGLRVLNTDGTAADVMRAAGFRRLRRPTAVTVLDVHANPDDQLRACRGKWRNAYRQGVRQNLQTQHLFFNNDRDAWLFSADRAQQKTKGYRALPAHIVQAMAAHDRKAVMVSQVMQGPTPIAAMLFLIHGTAATYQVGVTTAAGRDARAHHVLLMQACAKLAKRGVRQIELGLHQPKTSPGLARFKLGSGARVHDLGGTWMKLPFF